MRSKILFFLVILNFSAFAKDYLMFKNGKSFEGKVSKIEKCSIHFEFQDAIFEIPAKDIEYIKFGESSNLMLKKYINKFANDPDKCLKGQLDAEQFHGKRGTHFLLGVLFGPFAMIGTAVSNPTPIRGNDTYLLSKNKEDFNDPIYLSCYKKKAKKELIKMEGLGWGAWVLFVLLI